MISRAFLKRLWAGADQPAGTPAASSPMPGNARADKPQWRKVLGWSGDTARDRHRGECNRALNERKAGEICIERSLLDTIDRFTERVTVHESDQREQQQRRGTG